MITKIPYQRIIMGLSAFFWFSAIGNAAELQRETSIYQVTLMSVERHSNETKCTITLRVVDKRLRQARQLTFTNFTQEVRELTFLDHDRVMVFGSPSFTLLDLKTGVSIDEIVGITPSLSPDHTKLVYEFRYVGPPLYKTAVVLLYDLTKSPQENSMDGRTGNPENRGFILYPETNRLQKEYFIPAQSFEEQQHIISPFAWNAASTKICFVQQNGPGPWETRLTPSWLVVMDISDGVTQPRITTQQLDATLFYKMDVLKMVTQEPLPQAILAKELRFTDEDRSITVRVADTTVFDGSKVVTIPLAP